MHPILQAAQGYIYPDELEVQWQHAKKHLKATERA